MVKIEACDTLKLKHGIMQEGKSPQKLAPYHVASRNIYLLSHDKPESIFAILL